MQSRESVGLLRLTLPVPLPRRSAKGTRWRSRAEPTPHPGALLGLEDDRPARDPRRRPGGAQLESAPGGSASIERLLSLGSPPNPSRGGGGVNRPRKDLVLRAAG